MKRPIFIAVLFLLHSFCLFAEQKYWISFTDKAGTKFNPYEYFDARTVEQRLRYHIALADSSDFPVNQNYVEQVKQLADSVSASSRWLNGMAVYVHGAEVEKIKQLPFVAAINEMDDVCAAASYSQKTYNALPDRLKKLMRFQTERMEGEKFKEKKIDGSGIRIAVFDAGFPKVNSNPVFSHLFQNRKIIATHDFFSGKEDVFAHDAHGAATLSCIAGISDGENIGMATGAEFLLAHTEHAHAEPFSEEENWLAAAEWADKNGANIISSSLGYTRKRYFNNQMDGKKSLVARAATMAASKGILVICSAGNEGSAGDPWHFIATPADADSVLAVGGTNPYTDVHIYFSSYGPSSDGRLKPNVCALGDVVAATSSGLAELEGTSFSAPLVAGFAACAWQMHRDWNNMKLFDEVEKSAHLYPYFDYAHGYGIPQAGYFTDAKKTADPTFYFVILNNTLKVMLNDKYAHPETEALLGINPQRNLYYRLDGTSGAVKSYSVILARQAEVLTFQTDQFQKGETLTVHFEGYTSSYTITGE